MSTLFLQVGFQEWLLISGIHFKKDFVNRYPMNIRLENTFRNYYSRGKKIFDCFYFFFIYDEWPLVNEKMILIVSLDEN